MVDRAMRAGVVLAGAVALVAIVANSLDPAAYFSYPHRPRPQWEYPTGGVALTALATVLETALAYLVVALHRPRRLWLRALLALSLLVPWGWWISESILHAPGFWIRHVLWVWLLILGLGVGALVSAAQHVYAVLRPVRSTTP